MMKQDKEKIEFSKLTKKERREYARKMVFGEPSEEYMGNIWGTKFTLFSLVGLLIIGCFAAYAVVTGRFDPDAAEEETPYYFLNKAAEEREKNVVKDTLN